MLCLGNYLPSFQIYSTIVDRGVVQQVGARPLDDRPMLQSCTATAIPLATGKAAE
jgi:hypothetical protein